MRFNCWHGVDVGFSAWLGGVWLIVWCGIMCFVVQVLVVGGIFFLGLWVVFCGVWCSCRYCLVLLDFYRVVRQGAVVAIF